MFCVSIWVSLVFHGIVAFMVFHLHAFRIFGLTVVVVCIFFFLLLCVCELESCATFGQRNFQVEQLNCAFIMVADVPFHFPFQHTIIRTTSVCKYAWLLSASNRISKQQQQQQKQSEKNGIILSHKCHCSACSMRQIYHRKTLK